MAMGTTYGATDGPGGPFVAAILGLGGPSTATYFATDGLGDLFWGGPSVAWQNQLGRWLQSRLEN